MDQHVGVTKARENLLPIVQAAERGRTTYITRRGASGSVAAVVPMSVAEHSTRPAPARPLPCADGGTLTPQEHGQPSSADDNAWLRAALAALHHQLTTGLAATARALDVVGAAQDAHAAGDLSGALDQIGASALRSALEDLDGAGVEALLLREAAADPGPVQCDVCGCPLERHRDGTGWAHVPNEQGAMTEDRHVPVPRHGPPTRPDIRNGRVAEIHDE